MHGLLPPSSRVTGVRCSGGGARDDLPHARTAGEEDVVKALLQQRGRLRHGPLHHLHAVRVEVAREQIRDQRRGARRELGWLDDGAIAGGERGDQRAERQLQWVVPGADDQDHTQWLAVDAASRDEVEQAGFQGSARSLGLHPPGQVAQRVRQVRLHEADLGGVGFERRLTQVGLECLEDPRLVVVEQLAQPAQLLLAPGAREGHAGAVRGSQSFDDRCGGAGLHGRLASSALTAFVPAASRRRKRSGRIPDLRGPIARRRRSMGPARRNLVSMLSSARLLFRPKRPEPSYPRLPDVDEHGQTSVRGVYAVGEIAGTPLIKLGLNAGHDLVARLATELKNAGPAPDGAIDLLIVGAGSSGLGAAAAAQDVGLSAVVVEANHLAETVYTMTKGKLIFAEPEAAPKKGRMWFEECTREQLLERWAAQVEEFGLDVRTHEKVEGITRRGELLEVATDKETYRARRVILSMGKAGNPRKAGVPGEVEHASKIEHRLIDPDVYRDRDVLIYGGGDVALEAALALKEHNRVTLATIDAELTYPRKRNIDALRSAEAAGAVTVRLGTALTSIGEGEATLTATGTNSGGQTIANDVVFEMIGAELPLSFFAKIGVRLENTWHWKRWAVLFTVFLGVYSLYSLKSYGKGSVAWPFEGWIAAASYDGNLRSLFEVAFAPFAWIFRPEAYADILADRGFQQGYLYSLLYTIVMVVFGYQALIRWRGIATNKRYQTNRYITLLAFQVGFFLLVNLVAVQAFTVQHAWRAWGLYQPFPLFFNVFFWWNPGGDPVSVMAFFITAGIVGSLVVIPLLAWKHGKRFCTWVCGCGGLAETLGDRWRHLSPKGERSRRWEFQAVAVMLASFLVLIVVLTAYRGSGENAWWSTYNYLVDFWLVAVIPITLYPFFGGKVWCRYWCPLAAWNQVLAKWYGRLKIASNDKCISCTQCSKHCQVGVDVMAFAKNQEPFDNRNSSCIHCGICIDVCPMDVLSFDDSPREQGTQSASQ